MKEQYARIGIYTTVGQLTVLLATALREMQHGPTRQECFDFIKERKWLDIQPSDHKPYPTTTEPRWQNLLSWAREHLAACDLVDRSVKNSWRPTKDGLNTAVSIYNNFANGLLDVRKCYMWTSAFKKHMCPSYESSQEDAPRPEFVYEDELPKGRKSVRGNWINNLTLDDFI